MKSSRKDDGFTLVELLVTLVLLVVLTTWAVPGLRDISQDNRLAATVADFQAHLMLARSEAVKRGIPVVVCRSHDGVQCSDDTAWGEGAISFVDFDSSGARDSDEEEVLKVFRAEVVNGLTINARPANAVRISYGPLGQARDERLSPLSVTWVLCDQRGFSPRTTAVRMDSIGLVTSGYATRFGITSCDEVDS